jgi:FkbM family methyltransferase
VKSLRYNIKRSIAVSRMLGLPSASMLLSRSLSKLLLHTLLRRDNPQAVTHIHPPGCPAGLWIRPQGTDLDVALQIFETRDYDLSWCRPYKEHIEAMCTRIRTDGDVPVIIDAGANIGASTLWFSLNFPDCRVFAIEPDQANFEMLARNTADRPNVTPFHAGLWDRLTNLSVVSNGDDSWGRRVAEDPGRDGKIGSVTIPELLEKEPRLRLLIVKIDIEGAETAVFRSNTEWVDKVPLLIFEPHDNLWQWLGTWQGTGHAFFSALARRKREYMFRGENVFAFLHSDPV